MRRLASFNSAIYSGDVSNFSDILNSISTPERVIVAMICCMHFSLIAGVVFFMLFFVVVVVLLTRKE